MLAGWVWMVLFSGRVAQRLLRGRALRRILRQERLHQRAPRARDAPAQSGCRRTRAELLDGAISIGQ